ncbi:putative retrotransposon gag domain, nucleotide-binding alpha-beta plait domain protein [Tanacetum coccineum]
MSGPSLKFVAIPAMYTLASAVFVSVLHYRQTHYNQRPVGSRPLLPLRSRHLLHLFHDKQIPPRYILSYSWYNPPQPFRLSLCYQPRLHSSLINRDLPSYDYSDTNDSEVEVVFDKTANSRLSTSGKDESDKGYGTNSLLEQWRDSYPDNDDYDPYDHDMYENHDMSEHLQSICDDLDITIVESSSKADLIEIKCRTKDPCRDKSVTSGIRASRFEAMTNENEKIGASGSPIVDENWGRDDVHQNPKKRGTSKDVVASLDQRVAGVETSMAELKNQVEGLEGLDSDFTSMREDFRVALNTLSGDLKREIHDLRDSFMGEITKIREGFGEEVSTLHQVIEGLQADMALCKRSLASGGGNTNHDPKIDVPKPSPFVEKREARAVNDFLWEMEQYLEGVNVVDDASKIKMATQYLKDTTALWWRRRYGDIERVTATIDTWDEFVADFKKQLYPDNVKNKAKSRLRKLKQSKTIREYLKEFTTLVLEIPELSCNTPKNQDNAAEW